MSKEIRRWSQQDIRWCNKRLGPSVLTCKFHGCLVTAIANYTDKTPGELIDLLEFTDDNHPSGGGKILWNTRNKETLRKLGLDYVDRYRRWEGQKDRDAMFECCQSQDYFPLLEVETKSGGRHWVTPISRALTWRGLGWAVNDPWNAKREWKTVGFMAPYVRETGWLLFTRPL